MSVPQCSSSPKPPCAILGGLKIPDKITSAIALSLHRRIDSHSVLIMATSMLASETGRSHFNLQ